MCAECFIFKVIFVILIIKTCLIYCLLVLDFCLFICLFIYLKEFRLCWMNFNFNFKKTQFLLPF